MKKLLTYFDATEFQRFGLIVPILLITTCIGGIAAATAGSSIIGLAMVAFPAMGTLSMVLGVAPMRYIWMSGIMSIICSIIVILLW